MARLSYPFNELYEKQTDSHGKEARQFFLQEVWRQISIGTKMACALNWRKDACSHEGDHKMMATFSTRKPLGKNGNWQIVVILDPSDTYTVKLVLFRNKPLKGQTSLVHVEEEHSDIYCDDLSETIYRMCNK